MSATSEEMETLCMIISERISRSTFFLHQIVFQAVPILPIHATNETPSRNCPPFPPTQTHMNAKKNTPGSVHGEVHLHVHTHPHICVPLTTLDVIYQSLTTSRGVGWQKHDSAFWLEQYGQEKIPETQLCCYLKRNFANMQIPCVAQCVCLERIHSTGPSSVLE